MKPITMSVLTVLIVAISFTSSCKKSSASAFMNSIKITGPNMTVPPCAPVFNAIWQGTNQADSFVSLSNTPASIGLNNATVYPVYMNVNWVSHTPSCLGMITITSYQLQ